MSGRIFYGATCRFTAQSIKDYTRTQNERDNTVSSVPGEAKQEKPEVGQSLSQTLRYEYHVLCYFTLTISKDRILLMGQHVEDTLGSASRRREDPNIYLGDPVISLVFGSNRRVYRTL